MLALGPEVRPLGPVLQLPEGLTAMVSIRARILGKDPDQVHKLRL